MEKLHTLSTIGRAVILTAAVAEILAVFPATFPMSYLIFPLPVGMSFFAYGLRRAVVTALGMTAVAALVSSPPAALLLLAFSGPYGFFAGAFFRYGWSLKKLIVLTAAYIAVLMTLFFAALYVTMDINVFAAARQELDAVITRGLANVADTGISEIELMNTRRNVTAVLEVLPLIIPSAMIIAAAVIVYCTAKVCRFIMCRSGLAVPPVLPIRFWEMGRPVVYLYVLAQVMQYWGTTREIFLLNGTGVNLDTVTFFLISLNGLAVIFFFLQRHFQIGAVTQGILVFLYWFVPVPTQYITFLSGMADILFRYRRKYRVD